MGWRDRPYHQEGDDGREVNFGRVQLALPRPTAMVIALMVACTALILAGISESVHTQLFRWGSLLGPKAAQAWRLVSFQFLHASASHFMWNMLGLYFFGPPLERAFGRWRFLAFYLTCGVFGGLCFLAVVAMAGLWHISFLVGASGGVLGCLAACAILYKDMLIIVFPIRWVAAFYIVLFALSTIRRDNLGDAAHLGGMVAAFIWIMVAPWAGRRLGGLVPDRNRGRWEKKMRQRLREQEQIDAILEKIRRAGIGSLSWREKRTLQQATDRQRQEDRRTDRMA